MLLFYEEDGLLGCRECTEFHESYCQLGNGNRNQLMKGLTDLGMLESVSDKLPPRLLKREEEG